MASDVALPVSVPTALPLISTVVPVPGMYVRIMALPLGMASIHDSSVLKLVFTSAEAFGVLLVSPSSQASAIWLLLTPKRKCISIRRAPSVDMTVAALDCLAARQ